MSFRLVIETVDTPIFGGTVWLGGWRLRNADRIIAEKRSDPFDAQLGHHDKGLYPVILEAMKAVPAGSEVRIICRSRYLVTEINRPSAHRIATGYLKTNGKPLSEVSLLRQIDEVTAAKSLVISAAPPETDNDHRDSSEIRVQLDLLKEDVGKKPGWRYWCGKLSCGSFAKPLKEPKPQTDLRAVA